MEINFGQNLYKVTKIKVKNENEFRFVNKDDNFVGQAMLLENGSLVVGRVDRFNSDGLITSKVYNLQLLENGNWTIETMNSVYIMELLHNEDN